MNRLPTILLGMGTALAGCEYHPCIWQDRDADVQAIHAAADGTTWLLVARGGDAPDAVNQASVERLDVDGRSLFRTPLVHPGWSGSSLIGDALYVMSSRRDQKKHDAKLTADGVARDTPRSCCRPEQADPHRSCGSKNRRPAPLRARSDL